MRKIFFALAILLFSNFAFAITIGVSPGVLTFPRMIKEGYAEQQVLVSTSSPDVLIGHLEVEGDIAGWVSFRPASSTYNISSGNPYLFTVIITPPRDTPNGNYSGIIRVVTDQLAEVSKGAGSAIIAAVAVRVDVEVIGEQLIICRAGAFSVTDAEISTPIRVSATIFNDGNIKIRPEFQVAIENQDTNVMTQSSFIGSEILPTLNKRISKDIDHSLKEGQYFADIYVKECDIRQILSFDVVEKGGIIDKGTFIGIRTNDFAYVDEYNPIIAMFRNDGIRVVSARFKGDIKSLNSNKVLETIQSEDLQVEPGQTIEFSSYYMPKEKGKYQVSGRILYNKKITFDEQSKVVEAVVKERKVEIQPLFFMIIYLIIGLITLILIGKIRKERRRRYSFK